MFVTAAAYAVILIYNERYEYGMLAYLMTFFWGIQDAFLNTIMNCILGFEFHSKIISFSLFKFVQSIFIFAFLMLQSVITTKSSFRIYFICTGVFAFLSMIMMLFFRYKDKKRPSDQVREQINTMSES